MVLIIVVLLSALGSSYIGLQKDLMNILKPSSSEVIRFIEHLIKSITNPQPPSLFHRDIGGQFQIEGK